MGTSPWQIDPAVAADLMALIGWAPADRPAALTARIPQVMACGSTAKLAAMDRDEVPPGAEPDGLAREVLDVAARRERGEVAPSPAWSCWGTAAVTAALLHAGGCTTEVAAIRRIDRDVVDLHAALTVAAADGTRWICDPFFGLSVPFPSDGTARASWSAGEAAASLGPDGRWTFDVRLGPWSAPCRYRVLAPVIDRGDVRTICEISTRFSGVSFRRHARLHLDASIVEVGEAEGGGASVSVWGDGGERGQHRQVTDHRDWGAAVSAFAEKTGVRVL